jgi:DNA-binding LytR/AlgR family response regulator
MVQTEKDTYFVKKSLSGLEEDLNPKRFFRISQSEIVNISRVKRFDINMAGTIGVEFENGQKSWAARSRVRAIKDMIRELTKERN